MKIIVTTPGHLRTVPMGRYAAETLRRLGHEVVLLDAGTLTLSEKLVLRPLAKLRGRHRFEKTRLNQRVWNAVREFQPDLFFSIFGFDLFPETLASIRKDGVRTACWWLNDPIQFERGLSIAPGYDHFFSNCESSTGRYREAGVNADYLPHAGFISEHRPFSWNGNERSQWESEICFVGDWGPMRQGLLSMLSKKFDLRIWGPWHKHLSRKDRLWGRVTNGYFTTEDMVRAMSATKIALNIHSWFGYYEFGLNPRTFETPACGALQVCDWKRGLASHFCEGEELVTYRTGDELEGRIRELLQDAPRRERIAAAGHKRVLSEHTYEHRMLKMLQKVG